MTRLRPRGDDGAYAILYALLLLVVLGMAALVVDVSALRQNRRATRSASDAAAIAAARELDIVAGSSNPRAACQSAWSYLATNLGFTVPSATGCDGFPVTAAPCPLTWPAAIGSVGDYTVKITWPVADDSTLLTNPDVRPATTGVTTQAIDPQVDGTDPCTRIAVSVQQDEEPAFGTVFGSNGASTVVTSVARAAAVPGTDGPIAALNVLEDNDCQAIRTTGQASVEIAAVGTRPGIIAVESSGLPNCKNNEYVIDVTTAASGGHVWANGPTGVGTGTIFSFALNPASNVADAYNPATVPPTATLLRPKPIPMAQTFGAAPVTNIYNCAGDAIKCPTSPEAYVNSLKLAFDRATPVPYAHAAYSGGIFKTVSVANGAIGNWSCTIGTNDTVLVPPGNWYVNCPTLTVQGRLIFAGGNVVTAGGIDVKGGCFAMNVPLTSATACPTQNVLGEVIPPATTEGILFLRGGNFTKGAQAAIYTERTFVYMKSGAIDFGAGSGALYMTNPKPDPDACDKPCQNSRFGKVALWNESTATQQLGGQAAVVLRGILFTPNATFQYNGQASQVQTNAQFWANKLVISGQGTLVMAPDESDSIPRPELGTVLIR